MALRLQIKPDPQHPNHPTLNWSQVECSCNAALYWISMPGIDSNGQPALSDKGNYYCDSNKVWGVNCWEMDSLEGNKHVMKVTPHTCEAPPGTYSPQCDGKGPFPPSGYSPRKGLCPEASCTIDSRRPFTHRQKVKHTIIRNLLL